MHLNISLYLSTKLQCICCNFLLLLLFRQFFSLSESSEVTQLRKAKMTENTTFKLDNILSSNIGDEMKLLYFIDKSISSRGPRCGICIRTYK